MTLLSIRSASICFSLQQNLRCYSTVISCHRISNCGQTPMSWLVEGNPIGLPEMQALPSVGGYIPVRIEMSVVLPAPFGPKNPKIQPLVSRRVNGLSAILLISPLLPVYFLLMFFIIKAQSTEKRSTLLTSQRCLITDTSTIPSLNHAYIYIAFIQNQVALLALLPLFNSSSNQLKVSPFLQNFSNFSIAFGLLATPYSCCTISLSQTDKMNTPNHPQRMIKAVKGSASREERDWQQPVFSEQDHPKRQMILQRAKGGQRSRGKGKVVGTGYIKIVSTYPIRLLNSDNMQPTIVAVLELLMKIWTKLVIPICAIAHPTITAIMSPPELSVKNLILNTKTPKKYIASDESILSTKLTMKKPTQQCLESNPFIFMISICLSSFSETTMYSRMGIRSERPSGYRPEPSTSPILSIKALSSPENGMYMQEPVICQVESSLICRNAPLILSNRDIIPSVTRKYVNIAPGSVFFSSSLVAPLFLWYSANRRSLIENVAERWVQLDCAKWIIPSGISESISSPLQIEVASALSRHSMSAALLQFFLINTELNCFSAGQYSLSCKSSNSRTILSEIWSVWQQLTQLHERLKVCLSKQLQVGKLKGCGQLQDCTLPSVIPPIRMVRKGVKRRQKMGVMIWHILEHHLRD